MQHHFYSRLNRIIVLPVWRYRKLFGRLVWRIREIIKFIYYSMRRCQGRTLATVGKEAGEAEVYTVQSWHDKNCWRSYNECEKNFQISHSCANWANCYVFIRVNMSATISNHQFENLSYCLCPIPLRPLVSWSFFFFTFCWFLCLLIDVPRDLLDRRKWHCHFTLNVGILHGTEGKNFFWRKFIMFLCFLEAYSI